MLSTFIQICYYPIVMRFSIQSNVLKNVFKIQNNFNDKNVFNSNI